MIIFYKIQINKTYFLHLQRNPIQEAARNLLSLLNSQLQEDSTTPQPEQAQQQLTAPSRSTVQQEMTRLFLFIKVNEINNCYVIMGGTVHINLMFALERL